MFPRHFPLLAFLFALGLSVSASAQPPPGELLKPSLVADTTAVAPGKPFTVGVWLKLAPGWHTYWQFPGDSGGAPKVTWELPAGYTAGPIQWPVPESHFDREADLLTYIYEDEVLLPVEITPPAQLPPGEVTLRASVRFLVCEKTCVPDESAIALTLPVGDLAPANAELFATWRSRLPLVSAPPFAVTWDTAQPGAIALRVSGVPAGAELEFFPLPPGGAKPDHPKVAADPAGGAHTITVPFSADEALAGPWRGVLALEHGNEPRRAWLLSATANSDGSAQTASAAPLVEMRSLWRILGLAFLGGLILNVMPCVLPVIALKIFGFTQQAGEAPHRVFRLGLAFVAGVFTFFLALATVVIALKAAGRDLAWGYQFQNPFLLAGLIALVFVFGLNLLGVFEITLPSEAASGLSKLSGREGYSGAFLHGLFTTLLGTSCTAPFLATSLGYAVTQPAPIVFLLFATIAAGMSLPYFLLTARPAWMRFLPKPGLWMERAKQLMGFVLLALVAWLLGVLARSRPDAVAPMGWFLVALAIGCWMFGAFARRPKTWAIIAALVLASYGGLLHGALSAPRRSAVTGNAGEPGSIPWEPFSEEKLAAAVSSGRPVFVDFTADWCLNCKVFERTVLETDAVRTALREKGVLTLQADWTDGDAAITRALKKFGRVGVPLYVLHRPGEPQPVVLDGLTKSGLLEQLARIKR